MMDEFVNILDDIGDIGTIPQELDEYYDELARNKRRAECDAEAMRSWGCVVGRFGELNHCTSTECPISHDTFAENTVIVITKCEHVFKYESLREWFSQSYTCPVCRKNHNVTT